MPISRYFLFRMFDLWSELFIQPSNIGSGVPRGPGSPRDVLGAELPDVAVAADALAGVFVAALGVVAEVVPLDHVLGVGSGGPHEGGMNAEAWQVPLRALLMVQG